LQRSCSYEETGVFPTVDPSQVYYVLNAQENLPDCEKKLLPVFETNKFTGLAGNFPSLDLLKEVLKTSEIFLYIGHGSGLNSMMNDVRETLDINSCMVLMACSNGAVELNGSYNPSGLIVD
ncbi:separase isoform X1, partial [Tanacetum coccineum]